MSRQGHRMGAGARKPKRLAAELAAILAHLAFGGVLAGFALTLSEGALGILAAEMIVFLMLMVTLSYVWNFRGERLDAIREGPIGISRSYLLFLTWAGLGYLAVLLSIGPVSSPSEFIGFLFGFWALFVVFLISFVIWRRQNPPRVA